MKNNHDDIRELSLSFLRLLEEKFKDRDDFEKVNTGLLSMARLVALLAISIEEPVRKIILETFFLRVIGGIAELELQVLPEFFTKKVIEKAMKNEDN
jgi:hypothetical protein